MIRKNKKTAGVLIFAVILTIVFCMAVSVAAAEKRGSITVELNEIGSNRESVALECFQTAEKMTEGWKLTETFAGSGVRPWNLSKSADYKKTAEKLSFWAEKKKLSAQTERTDKNGTLVFGNLQEGIYLIRQKGGEKTYGMIAPFLICIPEEENGTLFYDVHTNTKGEASEKTSPVPSVSLAPSGSSGSSAGISSVKTGSSGTGRVKTGDDTALAVFWILLAVAAGGTVGILYYRKKR